MVIIMDSNEPEWAKEIADRVKSIGYDIYVGTSKRAYIIERKDLHDLSGRIQKGDFEAQLERLKETVDEVSSMGVEAYPVLLLEGNVHQLFNSKIGAMTRAQYYGLIVKLPSKNIYLVKTESKADTQIALGVLDKQLGQDNVEVVATSYAIKKSLNRSMTDKCYAPINMLDGVGKVATKKLFDEFKSICGVVNASEAELVKILGKKKGENVYKIIHNEVR